MRRGGTKTHPGCGRFCVISAASIEAYPKNVIGEPPSSVQARLPIIRHLPSRARHRLILRVPPWFGESLATDHFVGPIVIKPRFSRFETSQDRVLGRMKVLGRMLAWRSVAAADMPTLGTTPQVKPPTTRCKTLHAALAARWHEPIHSFTLGFHNFLLSVSCRGSGSVATSWF